MLKEKYIKPLSEALQKRDLIEIRAAVITQIDNDSRLKIPVAKDVSDEVAKELEESSGLRLYEEENGRSELPTDETLWNKELWNRIKAHLRMNFSREKVAFACEIMKKLRKDGLPEFQPQKESDKFSSDSSRSSSRSHKQGPGDNKEYVSKSGFNCKFAKCLRSMADILDPPK